MQRGVKVAPYDSIIADIDDDVDRILSEVDTEIYNAQRSAGMAADEGSDYYNNRGGGLADSSSSLNANNRRGAIPGMNMANLNQPQKNPNANNSDNNAYDNNRSKPNPQNYSLEDVNRDDNLDYADAQQGLHPVDEEGDHDEEDDEEEVLLAHQTDEGSTRVMNEFREKLDELYKQIAEYRARLARTQVKLRDTELNKADLEEKVNDLEDEKNALQEELESRDGNGGNENSKDGRSFNGGAGVSTSGMRKNNNRNSSEDAMAGELLRKAMMAYDDVDTVANFHDLSAQNKLYIKFKNFFLTYLQPFKSDIRLMQSRFGSSAAAYFAFYRFIFLQYVFFSIFVLYFAIVHGTSMTERGLGDQIFVFHSFVPGFMRYSSFDSSEALLYVSTILLLICLALFTIAEKYLREDKLSKALSAIEAENETPYGTDVLCAWDFSFTSADETKDFAETLRDGWADLLVTSINQGKIKQRSLLDKVLLYSKRTFGFFAYIGVQCVSFTLIIYWTVNGSVLTDSLRDIPVLSSMSSVILSLLLSFINGVTPPLIKNITKFESWDEYAVETYYCSFRMFLSNGLNTLLFAFSYILLVDPFLFAADTTYRDPIVASHEAGKCRFTEVGDGIFAVLITTFPLDIFFMLVGCVWKAVKSTILRKSSLEHPDFEVADSIIRVLNFIGIAWMCLPYNPLVMLIMPVYIFVNIKTEKLILWGWYVRPKKPWKAQKAGTFFTTFYLLEMTFVCIPFTIYFLSTKTFPKNCNIQDDFVRLCAATTSNEQSCVVDTSSVYYAAYGSGNQTYPGSICSEACGAFVGYENAFAPFVAKVKSVSFFEFSWSFLFVYPYIPWLLAGALIMVAASRFNTIEVANYARENLERIFEAKVSTLTAENIKLNKRIEKLKNLNAEIINESEVEVHQHEADEAHHDNDHEHEPSIRKGK